MTESTAKCKACGKSATITLKNAEWRWNLHFDANGNKCTNVGKLYNKSYKDLK